MGIEMISMIGGAVSGFIFRYLSERAKEKADLMQMALNFKKASDDSADRAAKRVSIDVGKWVRRLIVICVLFGVIMAPFILALMGHSTIVQVETEQPTSFFGLFGGGIEVMFVELPSFLLVPELTQALTAIVGFYFGNAAAARKT